jgi:hypothetical protein
VHDLIPWLLDNVNSEDGVNASEEDANDRRSTSAKGELQEALFAALLRAARHLPMRMHGPVPTETDEFRGEGCVHTG